MTLIAGPTNLPDVPFVKMVHITSAQDMYEAVTEAAKESDIIVKAAAVAAVSYTHLDLLTCSADRACRLPYPMKTLLNL